MNEINRFFFSPFQRLYFTVYEKIRIRIHIRSDINVRSRIRIRTYQNDQDPQNCFVVQKKKAYLVGVAERRISLGVAAR
jgi:hypothetical protein